jgi:uncharacterized membrane protein YdjX (TVP38/TMEM64 family)
MRAARIGAIVVIGALMLVAHHSGLLDDLGEPARLQHLLLDLGWWGYLAFIAAYTLLQPFGVPGTVFVFAAPLVWPWPVAFGLSMVGTCAASVVGFSFSRFIARDWVAARLPHRFNAWNDALAQRAFTTVFLLRLVFWMPQVLHAFFGLSKVGFWTHLWGSAAGYVLPLLVVSYFGRAGVEALLRAPESFWAWLGVGLLIAAGLVWLVSRRRSLSGVARRSALPQPAPRARRR